MNTENYIRRAKYTLIKTLVQPQISFSAMVFALGSSLIKFVHVKLGLVSCFIINL